MLGAIRAADQGNVRNYKQSARFGPAKNFAL
jgi:hypothetical protein